jgi:hypothetical protein
MTAKTPPGTFHGNLVCGFLTSVLTTGSLALNLPPDFPQLPEPRRIRQAGMHWLNKAFVDNSGWPVKPILNDIQNIQGPAPNSDSHHEQAPSGFDALEWCELPLGQRQM